MPILYQIELLEAINAALYQASQLNSAITEIREVKYADLDRETISVSCFGMNNEPLTYLVYRDLMEDEIAAKLIEGTII